MDIPDESPWAPAPDIVRVEFLDSGEITPELTVGLLADIKQVQRERDAAIARAAQVQILREMADEFNGLAERWAAMDDHARSSVYGVEARRLERRSAGLAAPEQPTPTEESP